MSKISDLIFVRDKHVCPWWLCFTFDNIFRKLIHDPYKMLSPYIKEGDTVLDVGPGMGYFTIPMAKMVGMKGRVIAADIQERMLLALKKRAHSAGLEKRIIGHLSSPDSLGIKDKVDFILAFYMVHEVPDRKRFFNELYSALKDKGTFLLVEPPFHVTKASFAETVNMAMQAGFSLSVQKGSRSVLLAKKPK